MNIPKNGFYKHYKHSQEAEKNNYIYEVVGIARHTEDKTYAVLYRPMYKSDWLSPANYCARPLEMFMEQVVVDEKTLSRFTLITDSEKIKELDLVRAEMYGNISTCEPKKIMYSFTH
jgi:hypothetical protein